MVQSKGNEWLTAFVSTVVAVAILGAGLTANQSQAPKEHDVVKVASDLCFQFEMAFRHDTRERDTRLAQLDALMAAWQASPQSSEDREALESWLLTAAGHSLPGRLEPLPDLPQFSKVTPPVTHEVNKVPTVVESALVHEAPQKPQDIIDDEVSLTVQSQGPAPTLVTPTPADPLEEEMIALRQPQSINPELAVVDEAHQQAIAPRPGLTAQPTLAEKSLLASVPAVKPQIKNEPVDVNLTELTARIAGYHDALDEVETALLRLDTPSLDSVIEQIQQLDAMTRDYGFVQLYYESLTDAERRRVIEPRSMKSTLGEVKRQLARCEETLDGDFLGTFDKAAEEEIANLRDKIAEIENRVKR